MNTLPNDVIQKIFDFKNGDNIYWKKKFDKVVYDVKYTRSCLYCDAKYYTNDKLLKISPDGLCHDCENTYCTGQFLVERGFSDRECWIYHYVEKYFKMDRYLFN